MQYYYVNLAQNETRGLVHLITKNEIADSEGGWRGRLARHTMRRDRDYRLTTCRAMQLQSLQTSKYKCSRASSPTKEAAS